MNETTRDPNRIVSEDNRLRIKYEVPLVWLLGVMAVIVAQAATVYFSQLRQGEILVTQSDSIKDLAQQVRALNAQLGGANSKDIEHDYRIADHERRLSALENLLRNKP